jgi:hypothetical protein
MAVVAGFCFALALLFSPTHGVLTERMRSSADEPLPDLEKPAHGV